MLQTVRETGAAGFDKTTIGITLEQNQLQVTDRGTHEIKVTISREISDDASDGRRKEGDLEEILFGEAATPLISVKQVGSDHDNFRKIVTVQVLSKQRATGTRFVEIGRIDYGNFPEGRRALRLQGFQ
jgi:hypothetical protein